MGVSRRAILGATGAGLAMAVSAPAQARPDPGAVARGAFGHAPGVAFLARNENPYGPSPAALRAMAATASAGCYYANEAESRLAAMIAERHGLTPDHVMIGNGSTEVLNCATMAFGRDGGIVAPELLFEPPLSYAEKKGVAVTRVPLGPDMGMDLKALAAAVSPGVGLVHLCNPNNPTGLLVPGAAMRAFVTKVSPIAPVLVDEAYNELTDDPVAHSVVDRVKAGDRVIVTRTFSKLHGLAGLRVGYAIARPDLIAAMKGWSMSNGGNTAGLAAAMASYDDRPFLAMSKARIVEARGMIEAAARAQGLATLPSAANFVLVRVPDAERLRKALADRDVVIRGPYGKWTQWSRVSCGRIEDVRRYAAALPAALAA
ncbi:pyridoxal phosphate-dependent aminotransferase [Thermaurantiacus sp.]